MPTAIPWQEKALLESHLSSPPGRPLAHMELATCWLLRGGAMGYAAFPERWWHRRLPKSRHLCSKLRGGPEALVKHTIAPMSIRLSPQLYFHPPSTRPLRLGMLCSPGLGFLAYNRLGCLQPLLPERKAKGVQGRGVVHLKTQFLHPIKTTLVLIKDCKIYLCILENL